LCYPIKYPRKAVYSTVIISILGEQAFEFLFNTVKEIVPKDDPRIKAIEDPDYLKDMFKKSKKE
jgi:hypothetical protein